MQGPLPLAPERDLSLGPLFELLQTEFARKDPARHRTAPCVEELAGSFVQGRVPGMPNRHTAAQKTTQRTKRKKRQTDNTE
eukprot:3904019-Rhodomonas_salina.2